MTYSEHGCMEVLIIEFRINLCIYCYDVYIEAFTVNVITINAKVDGKKVRTYAMHEKSDVRNFIPYHFYLYAQ